MNNYWAFTTGRERGDDCSPPKLRSNHNRSAFEKRLPSGHCAFTTDRERGDDCSPPKLRSNHNRSAFEKRLPSGHCAFTTDRERGVIVHSKLDNHNRKEEMIVHLQNYEVTKSFGIREKTSKRSLCVHHRRERGGDCSLSKLRSNHNRLDIREKTFESVQ
ncbi:hypothetical protein J6590_028928 [Homalodisca vitripennis]|nr:hypothetical protein J6590_028928 [Homalodisca vitripennis]